MAQLPRSFFARNTVTVAQELLGVVLSHGATAGLIVETEAYLGQDDLAAHAARGRRPSTELIYGPPGFAYVYLNYGVHWCLNFVAEPDGVPGCVLLRALQPVAGLDIMRQRRNVSADRQLCSGPGKLTQALGITGEQSGVNLLAGPLVLDRPRGWRQPPFVTTPRIGITKCANWPLRFVLRETPWASR